MAELLLQIHHIIDVWQGCQYSPGALCFVYISEKVFKMFRSKYILTQNIYIHMHRFETYLKFSDMIPYLQPHMLFCRYT